MLVLCVVEAAAQADTNLALNGAVTCSATTWPGQPASNLTDGNLTTVSHPAEGEPVGAFYTVDLGVTHPLGRVVIFNRRDCCSDRLSNYRVELLTDSAGTPGAVNWSGTVRGDGTSSGQGGSDTVRMTDGIGSFSGRFIRVTDLANLPYQPQIAEIEAYAPVTATIRYFITNAGNIRGPGLPASATLSWVVEGATSVSISEVGNVPASGSTVVAPESATTYTLTAMRAGAANVEATIVIAANAEVLAPKMTEFQAADGSIEDENGDRPDWIELHNPNSFTLNLAGYTLTDSALVPAKWTFPLVNIAPGGYALVYASGKNRAITGSPLHTNFSLAASGEYLALSAPGGALVQQIPADYPTTPLFPKQYDRVTYGLTAGGAAKYFKPATPGAANGVDYEGVVADTSFSVKRGLFSTPQSVAMTSATEGATIRYTTDGTEPTETTGIVYTTPIAITTTTILRAAAFKANFAPSKVDTSTYLFPAAVVAAPNMSTTITRHATYGPQMIAALSDIPSISVVSPSEIVDDRNALCSFEWIPVNGLSAQENAGIELFGGAYTNFQKKSFRVAFKADYGAAKIEIPDLFTSHARGWKPVTQFDSLELRSGSHDMAQRGFYMSNPFTDGTMLDMGNLNPHSRFVHLYLNGSYQGMYQLRERWDANMHSAYLGGPSGDYESINGNLNEGGWAEPGNPYDGDGSSWTRVKSLRANFEGVSPYLDVTGYVDYMLMVCFGKSEEEYRTVSPKGVGSGFKFLLNDADGYLASSNYINDVPSNRLALVSNPSPGRETGDGPGSLFSQLWQEGHADYKMLLADRIHRHLFNRGALTPAVTNARLTAMCREINRAIYAESARWVDSGESRTPATWASERNNILKNFLPTRTGIYLSQLKALGYYPSVAAPAFGGGIVASGTRANFAVAGATVYFTKDGSDPRLPGGAVNPRASVGTSTSLTGNTRLRARALSGNRWSALNEAFYTVTTPAAPGDIVFSEIHYHPQGDDDSEFIELWNPTTHAVNLRGTKFTTGIGYDFPDNRDTLLAPGERILLVASLYHFQQRYGIGIPVAGVYFDRLGDDGDTITLATSGGTQLISLQYQDHAPWPETANGTGYSIVLADAALPTAAASWRSSTEYHGTPGWLGTGSDNRVIISEVLSASVAPATDMIELYNTTGSAIAIGGWFLSDDGANLQKYRIPEGTVLPAGGYMVFHEDTHFGLLSTDPGRLIGFGLSSGGDTVHLTSAVNDVLTDYRTQETFGPALEGETIGNFYKASTGTHDFVALANATPGAANSGARIGPIAITEIHYQTSAGVPQDAEFIELTNVSASPVTLYDEVKAAPWRMTEGILFDFPSETPITMQPNQRILLTRSLAQFNASYTVPNGTSVYQWTSGSLSDLGEPIELSLPGGVDALNVRQYVRVDRVNYAPSTPWPAAAAGYGYSLHKIAVSNYGNDFINWTTAAPSPGEITLVNPTAPSITTSSLNTGVKATPYTQTLSATVATAPATWTLSSGTLPTGLNLSTNGVISGKPSIAGVYNFAIKLTDQAGIFTVKNFTVTIHATYQVPVVNAFTLGTTTIGSSYSAAISAINNPKTFSITGLPVGLTANATTGVISGRPKASGLFRVQAKATNPGGTSAVVTAQFVVEALPTNLIGSFTGIVERDATANGGLGARLTLTTTSTGSYSAKLTQGATTTSATGYLNPTAPQISVTLAGAVLSLTFDPSTNLVAGTHGIAAVSGWRSVWNALNPATHRIGYYSVGIDLKDSGDIGQVGIPQGSGYATFTVASTGTLTVAGKTSDGSAITSAGFLGPNGEIAVYTPLYANLGSLVGMLALSGNAPGAYADNTASGTLTWNKPTTVTRTYKTAFGPINLDVYGKYLASNTRRVILGLLSIGTAGLDFIEAGVAPSATNPGITFTYSSANVVTVPTFASGNNPGKTTLTISKNSGAISGAFALIDTNPALTRPVRFFGMIVRPASGTVKAKGYFLVPQKPLVGQTIGNSPILSGSVKIAQ